MIGLKLLQKESSVIVTEKAKKGLSQEAAVTEKIQEQKQEEENKANEVE